METNMKILFNIKNECTITTYIRFFLFYSTTNIEYLFYSPLPSGKAFGNSILILILKTYDIALANFDFLNFCHKDGFFSNIIDFSYSSAFIVSKVIFCGELCNLLSILPSNNKTK